MTGLRDVRVVYGADATITAIAPDGAEVSTTVAVMGLSTAQRDAAINLAVDALTRDANENHPAPKPE